MGGLEDGEEQRAYEEIDIEKIKQSGSGIA